MATLEVAGNRFEVEGRVLAMVLWLVSEQQRINAAGSGHLELHFAAGGGLVAEMRERFKVGEEKGKRKGPD